MPGDPVSHHTADPAAQGRDDGIVRRRMDHRSVVVVIRVGHHQGSRLAITNGRADAEGGVTVGGVIVGGVVGGVVDGDVVVVVDEEGGGGALVVGLLVGALEVGAEDRVWCVLGGGGGGAGECPVSGGVPVTYAGGGKFWTGTPTMSAFITADQVAVG
jgi:hypothetical protein